MASQEQRLQARIRSGPFEDKAVSVDFIELEVFMNQGESLLEVWRENKQDQIPRKPTRCKTSGPTSMELFELDPSIILPNLIHAVVTTQINR